MDRRTAQIVNTLDETGASILLQLLERPATEAELITAVGEPSQPTMHRRLERLEQAGLIEHEPGKTKAPGRRWSVADADETANVLAALLALSKAVEVRDAARREAAARRLRRSRASRIGMRALKGGRDRPS